MSTKGISIKEIAELLGFPLEDTRKHHLPRISKLERGVYSRADAVSYINKIREKQKKPPLSGAGSKARITRLRVVELSANTSTFTLQVEGISAEDFLKKISDMLYKEGV